MHNAITDVTGIRVGHYTDRTAITGCTVILCEEGAVGGVDVRGAAPGTRETDALNPLTWGQEVHADRDNGDNTFSPRLLQRRFDVFDLFEVRVSIHKPDIVHHVSRNGRFILRRRIPFCPSAA